MYVFRHFRGELSFAVSFWINYVGGLAFFTLASMLLIHTKDQISLVTLGYLSLALYPSASIGIPWLMVGTWRSASRYVAAGGRRFWALSVKALILVAAYNVCKLIVITIPMIGEYGRIITGDKDTPPYTIVADSRGEIIDFRGGLRAGAECEFKRQLESSTRIRMLGIESDGGRLSEGMRIGRMVRNRGLHTMVLTHCKSAATFIFICGRERIVTPKAKIGFHRPSGVRERSDDYADVRQFMKEAGISKEFIDRVLATSPDDMWYPTYEEMRQAGVVTGQLVDGEIRR
jgi:hypothetical protein